MNKKKKGNRNQLKAIKQLEQDNWLVGKVELGGKFEKNKDLFGIFDLVCVRKKEVLFVQVTSNRPHTHKTYLEFSHLYCCDNIGIQQWVYYDRKGWKKFDYFENENYHCEDERKKRN